MVSNHVLMTNVTTIPNNPNNNELSFAEIVEPLLGLEVSEDVTPGVAPANVNPPGSQ